jgi:ferritin-like metal-binding protein YciE
MVSEMTNPRELFLHELGDILYVEEKLADEVLPKLIEEVEDKEFKKGLERHLTQTRGHVQSVKRVFQQFGEQPKAKECIGFEGLKREHEELAGESSPALIDFLAAGAAARTEHYEIAAYEGLRRMAKALGEDKSVALLDEILKQEKETLREVEKITTRLNNQGAKEFAIR